jgi:hypothetical protein
MGYFDSGPVPRGMTAFIDGSERMKIYQPLKGESGFVMISSAFMTFAGFIMLFGSASLLVYGITGSKDHEWSKFLENYIGSRGKLFLYQLISKTFILQTSLTFFYSDREKPHVYSISRRMGSKLDI